MNRLTDLRETLEIMREFKVHKLTIADGSSVELHESAFFPTLTPADAKEIAKGLDAEEVCPCGHGLVTEHNEHGCLHACSMAACVPKRDTQEE